VFEQYTEKARRVLFFAQYEASQDGSPQIESEHLLLALLGESKDIASWLFQSSRSWEGIRKRLEQHTRIGEKIPISVDLLLSSECMRILAHAAQEAENLTHRFIGTEHVLLGILREPSCLAAVLLKERGVSVENVRKHLSQQSAVRR
jgi:ATP-dependent Clp protease ATP-binding subunit ClpC